MSDKDFDLGVSLENNFIKRALFVAKEDESVVVLVREENREVIDYLYNNNFLRCFGADYVKAMSNCNGDYILVDDLKIFKEWRNEY